MANSSSHKLPAPRPSSDASSAETPLHQQLDELITAEEMEAYPFLDHLSDLIEDLEGDA